MKSPKLFEDKNGGFTLIEAGITIAISIIILSIILPVGINFYLDYQFDSEHSLLFSLFQFARNLAMVNRNESDHGVYWDSESFIVFQGSSFAARDQSQDKPFPRAGAISVSGPTEIVFSALSGQTASSTFVVSDGRKSRDVYVNPEGLVYD
jgi:Tfp pilus assembly protein FimT